MIIIYLSDHGESLGENNLYLHGAPYFIAPEEQTKIPMIMWFSDSFITANKLNKNTIKTYAKQNEYSHDYLFDSVLGLMNVSTNIYNKNLDIFYNARVNS